jgi:drug/metabolite transporter (DMT)-like permease
MALAAPVFALIFFLVPKRPQGRLPTRLPVGALLLAGALFAADLLAWHAGIVRTTAANATLFGNSAAFMLAGWAIVRSRRAPDAKTAVALALALAGTALLFGLSAQLSAEHALGDALSILAAVFYTLYFLVIARLRGTMPPLAVAALITPACALWLALALPFSSGPVLPQPWWPVVLLALSSQVIGQGLIITASGHLPHTVMGMGLLVQPAIATTLGWALMGETQGLWQAFGGALVLAAFVLIAQAPPAKVSQ